MAEPKTRPTDQSVEAFLDSVPDERRRRDSRIVVDLMAQITGAEPVMWGSSIVGFGRYHYRYASGREGDSPVIGFSPRKQSLTLYLPEGFERHEQLLKALGKHKTGKVCLYVNKLADVNLPVLRELIEASLQQHVEQSD